jgi:hypothetical protein
MSCLNVSRRRPPVYQREKPAVQNFRNYPRKFYRQQCKKEMGPYLPVSRIWSKFSNRSEYPDSGSGSQEEEMSHTKRKKYENACFEQLVLK